MREISSIYVCDVDGIGGKVSKLCLDSNNLRGICDLI